MCLTLLWHAETSLGCCCFNVAVAGATESCSGDVESLKLSKQEHPRGEGAEQELWLWGRAAGRLYKQARSYEQ